MPTNVKGMVTLPKISNVPRHHPDCCLSLSTKLIHQIGQLQPPESTLISIGSGSGLLEALIHQQYPKTRVIGLEVNDQVNKYLPPENAITVKGTWDNYDKSSENDTWLFVYPRSPGLITRYIGLTRVPNVIIWLGPRRDWEEFRAPFEAYGKFKIEEIGDAGLASYEAMFVVTKEGESCLEDGSASLSTSRIDEI